ncbi:MAG: sll0787 family AIR synthase-like protein [Akkermansiaceae bacterium]
MLTELVRNLEKHPAVREKFLIDSAYLPAEAVSQGIALGDDCAAIPDESTGGYLLFAAEGMLDSFVEDDPWFAGYSAVMVNLSDIAAMGGRAVAITDILWSGNTEQADLIWQGMRAASEAYDVPIVGGHTTQISDKISRLGAAVLGRAGKNLLTSFDAQAGDRLVMVIDMDGAYQDGKPFWNASTCATEKKLRDHLELLPLLAEKGCVKACKDISNGGIIGTLAMLCHCSEVGVTLDLQALPIPENIELFKWLTSFPSYGYLIAVPDSAMPLVFEHFAPHGITLADIGFFTADPQFSLQHGNDILPLQIHASKTL